MFLIKNCTQIFMTLTNCFSYVRTKTQITGHLYKQRLCKCYKVYEDYIKFDT